MADVEFNLDRRKLDSFVREDNGLGRAIRGIAEEILAEAKDNIVQMGAVDTGHMLASGSVDKGSGNDYSVSFSADYSAYVHEGTENTTPRPFLARAAFKERGEIG